MRGTLDYAIGEILGSVNGLRAVVLSVAPDGLIAWCWSRENKPEIALGFAALDRAATVCLEGLGASRSSRNLLLTAQDAWVASWPLHDVDEDDDGSGSERLVLTTVFDGELRTGMVMVYGTRVRAHLRGVLGAARRGPVAGLRAQLVEFMLEAPDPSAALRDLAQRSNIDLHRLERLDELNHGEQQQLLELAQARPRVTSAGGLSVVPGRYS